MKRKLMLILTGVAAVLTLQAPAQLMVVNPTVLDADWETGHWTSGYAEFSEARANFQFKDSGGSFGFTEDYNNREVWQTFYATHEFARSGDYSVRFYSNPQPSDPQPYRTEIAYFGHLTFDVGDELYYSASYRPGANWSTGPKTWTTVISQWKIAGGGRPAFSLGMSNDGNHNISIARAYYNGGSVEVDYTPLGTLPLEQWSDFVFYFKWSASSDGVAKIWKDGVLIYDYSGITWYQSHLTLGYLQLGMYTQLEWGERTMHIDNVRIGDSMFINGVPAFATDPIHGADATKDVAYTDSIAGEASDPDGDPLTYSKLSGPAWLDVAADGTLSGTPGAGDVGLNVFTVRVADNDFGEATATLNITVDESPTLYVSPAGNHVPPFSDWATAATNIQDAVDAAVDGATVMVGDGHYLLTSEVTVYKQITIKSVNGADATIVDGAGSNRCFNLWNAGCVISGMTITNGYTTGSGGGIYCDGTAPLITNCVITGNSAIGNGTSGGGVYKGVTKNSRILGNISNHGGGVAGNWRDPGVVINCVVADNTARYNGGGINWVSAFNCTISGNAATRGGGAGAGEMFNCIIWDNVAYIAGPNIDRGNARYTCSPDVLDGLNGNITNSPLLVSDSHIATNSPCRGVGSLFYASGTDIDGQIWSDPPSMGADECDGSVTGPLYCAIESNGKVVAGHSLEIKGVVDGAPTMHVWGFGDGTSVTNDIHLEHVWSNPGTYSLTLTAYNDTYPAGVATTQSIYVESVDNTTIHVSLNGNDSNNGTTWAEAKSSIQAGVDAQDYSGGWVLISNGTYRVESEIKLAKDIAIQGIAGPENTVVDGQGLVRCFNLGATACMLSGLTITNGYAVGPSSSGGGVYCIGARPFITNCIVVGNTAGREGGGLHSGTVYDSAILNNVALSWQYGGGGMVHSVVHNCEISGNTAYQGGGVRESLVDNCLIRSNTAEYGGGIFGATAKNCTIVNNSALYYGGGMRGSYFNSEAYNCIFKDNDAMISGNDILDLSAIMYSRSPDLQHGIDGNITNAPAFIDPTHGDFRLLATSPCIDTGSNGVVTTATDLAGMERIMDGDLDGVPVVDMGAYEFQVITLSELMVPSINLKSKGRTPVSILTTDEFDASAIDPSTIRFAGASPVKYLFSDTDGDGDIDLKLHFITADLNIDPADGEVTLTGQTCDGGLLVWMDFVKVVPGK